MNTINKPWGKYIDLIRFKNLVVKIIIVYPNKKLSLQTHKKRQEIWFGLSGRGIGKIIYYNLTRNKTIKFGSIQHIQKKDMHRIINPTNKKLYILEVQFGHCDENDIIRYEDDFNRHTI